jgi:hypothetical protein
MYLVLSAFTSSPISLVATTKANVPIYSCDLYDALIMANKNVQLNYLILIYKAQEYDSCYVERS